MAKQFCKRSHDTFIVGRDKYGDCRECCRLDQKAVRERYRNVVQTAKNKPCADCGINYGYWVMDFDHLGNKEFTISGRGTFNYSVEKLLKEIAKCEVVCSNCHRTRTHNRKLAADHN